MEADFSGGDISSDGGIVLLREVDQNLKLLERAAAILPDDRDLAKVRYSQKTLFKQRVFALAQGWEDLNDHDTLRFDPLLHCLVGVGGSRWRCRHGGCRSQDEQAPDG